MNEARGKRQAPQSALRTKLEVKMRERGLKKAVTYDFADFDDMEESIFPKILGTKTCWVMCILLGLFIYSNTFFSNKLSQTIVSKTQSYVDGSKDVDIYWENIRNWVNEKRKNGFTFME